MRVISPKFGNTFEVTNVPNRSEILLHKGNITDDSHGCILVGEQFEPVKDKRVGVLASAKGFDEFLKRTEGFDEFQLRIILVEWRRDVLVGIADGEVFNTVKKALKQNFGEVKK